MASKTTLKAWYVRRLPTVAYVGAWLINSQATNRVRRKNAAKALTISPKSGPRFGVQKAGPVWGFVFYVDIARYSFSHMEPKKGVHFSTSIGVSFCCFSVVAIALWRLRGWLIFIRNSNSGRPTVLTVGSWFVVWLLNNRPALHTGRTRFTYPALKVVLKPIFWNHQKALFGPKTTSALWLRWT